MITIPASSSSVAQWDRSASFPTVSYVLLLSYIGDRLDLYSALAEISPATSDALAANTGLPERYVREWLSANAAGGYVEYDPATNQFSIQKRAIFLQGQGRQGFVRRRTRVRRTRKSDA